jgi:NACalpha-BTF3-like transcription factor
MINVWIFRDKELAAVKITEEDVELIMKEMELPRINAESVLREHNGNVLAALETLINA